MRDEFKYIEMRGHVTGETDIQNHVTDEKIKRRRMAGKISDGIKSE